MVERGWLMESSTKEIDCDHGEEVHRKQQLRLQNLPDSSFSTKESVSGMDVAESGFECSCLIDHRRNAANADNVIVSKVYVVEYI
jgi:hypothetical protein